MEDRSIWLPPGLEGGRLEPDDRASQSSLGNGGSRRRGPTAAARGNGSSREPAESDEGESAPQQEAKAERQSESRDQADSAPDASRSGPPGKGRDGGGDDDGRGRSGGGGDEGGGAREPEPKHRPSAVDAMGQDKHREVVGQRYGLSRSRQFLYYGIFFAFVVAAYFGLKTAASELDKAPARDPDQAPWSKPNAPQAPLGGFEPSSPGQRGPTDFQ